MRRWILPAALLLAGCNDSIVGPIEALPRPLSASEQELVSASNAFAFHLLREINREQPDSNLFISPLSASMALGMTMNGARGETSDSMRATLGFGGLSQPEINRAYRDLIELLRELDPRVEMLLGNSIWYADSFPFEPAFFDTTRAYFGAEVAGLDFADASGSARRINDWASASTRGKIDSIVEEGEFADAVMFLINAIYFKGTWTTQFDPADTRDAPFYDGSGTRAIGSVKMMNRTGPIGHYRGDGFEAADLPYGGGAFSMTVILPDRGADVNALLESLDTQRWGTIAQGMTEQNLPIYLPKFRLEYERSFLPALRALGMGIAIDGPADFTGMSSRGRELVITEVFQKTFVDVNEQGTEAAAVTKVRMGPTSAPPTFQVDRPFLFAIRERFSGTVLFIGKIVEPPTG